MANEMLCIDGMKSEKIDPSARIEGQSLIAGEFTRIGRGVVIRNSYIKNFVIEDGAQIIDSVLISDSPPWIEQPRSDFEAKWIVPSPPATAKIDRESSVVSSLLLHCTVGKRSSISASSCNGSVIGDDCRIDQAQCDFSTLSHHVTISGPTEVSTSWVGHHATIDKMGCNIAIYSNDLFELEFDATKGILLVKNVIDVPHASRYGLNVISSLHSGFIGPKPNGIMESFGRAQNDWGRFGNCMWYMGKNRFDPCCWVSGWTKVVGTPSQTVFRSYEDLLTRNPSTHLLPFTVSGLGSSSVAGQPTPGELYNGDLYKQRTPAWVFSYAPGAVFEMVKRVHAIAGKEIADNLVRLSLENAQALIRYTAHVKGVALNGASSVGWAGWLNAAEKTIAQHLESGLWEFSDGEPAQWRKESSGWKPKKEEMLLHISADALENQKSEEEILMCEHTAFERRIGPTEHELQETTKPSWIDPAATVSPKALIGPGVRIEGNSVIEEGSFLYRTYVKNSRVSGGAKLYRSYIESSTISTSSEVLCSALIGTTYRGAVTSKGARAVNCDLASGCRLDPFSYLSDSTITRGAIIGSIGKNIQAESNFFLVHPQGYAQHVKGVASTIKVDGKEIELQGLPMIGGGGRVFGTPEKPAELECCFIGSNSIIKEGVYVGLGCFIVEGLDPDEGLLPFTMSKGPGAKNDQLCAVLFQHPTIVISSIISPIFHGSDFENRPYVAYLITSKIRECIEALKWIQAVRSKGGQWDESSPYAKYRNLRFYSDAQLKSGMQGFVKALDDRRWEMVYQDGELKLVGNGTWCIHEGTAQWRPAV